ncbi:hypothetical protein WR25_02814 [Diploscapter pachys]|uniref:Transmembrane protein 135 N-terminal domain-containing protein n=1 Tax=Diploscapter pachys TaxID=2018661 RepID=A0A2A2LXZ6_9BILA|nr:hypothetical protein WR25_02814 [Diploscapter pachys]
MASFCAILIEKATRRRPLALYLANLGSETAYRQLANHGYLPRFNRGECVPLIAGIVLIMYLYSSNRLPQGLVKVLKTCAGVDTKATHLNLKNAPKEFKKMLQQLREKFGKSDECVHDHSCTTNCTMNRIGVTNKMVKNMLSGGIAGLSMVAFPNVTIAMYVLWKAIEVLYCDLYNRGYIPYIPYGDIILYTISTGYVLWMAALEPQAVRSGYREFLMGLTGGRLALFNRHLIDSFGYKSSLIYPQSFQPDPLHSTINPMFYRPLREM